MCRNSTDTHTCTSLSLCLFVSVYVWMCVCARVCVCFCHGHVLVFASHSSCRFNLLSLFCWLLSLVCCLVVHVSNTQLAKVRKRGSSGWSQTIVRRMQICFRDFDLWQVNKQFYNDLEIVKPASSVKICDRLCVHVVLVTSRPGMFSITSTTTCWRARL